jgi:galactokinase
VNLIGDHTDYASATVVLRSASEPEMATVPLSVAAPASVTPGWARYVAGVVAEVRPATGFEGTVSTTLPVGAGLSSSAALELAVALALGFEGSARELALLCQRAEQVASGVPCGVMDQLTSACGREGHALLLDFASGSIREVEIPDDVEVWVVHSGEARQLAGSAYAERRGACEAAAALVGPLGAATVDAVDALADPVLRRRARHVVTECERVRRFADALGAGDLAGAGRLMDESHASLRDDFEVSTPALDARCARLRAIPGVFGARLTGAGFGGCCVALASPDAPVGELGGQVWRVTPAAGARLLPVA